MELQRLAPQAPISHRVTGQAYLARGQYADAILSFRRALELSDGDPWLSAGLGHALTRSGDEAAAREILVDLFALAEHRYVNPVEIGYLHLGLGEDEGALTWFERAVDGHAGWVNHLQYRPGIERLRSHPRFQELLRRMNLVD
jgi:Flp pilus assembly protein TadD